MKKGAAFVFPLLVVFLHLFASCSYAPSDPTPYIPQEYRDAFLCSGSFTLEETKEAAPEEGRKPFCGACFRGPFFPGHRSF